MQSEITFGELVDPLPFVKIIYNGEVIFDDYDEERNEDIHTLRKMMEEYKNKIVYEMHMKVVDFHHCILEVEGEDV